MLDEGESELEEQKSELINQPKASSPKKPLAVGRNTGKAGNQFFLYIPQELSNSDKFPFQPGTRLVLEVREESLVIRADEHERNRVPFLPPNSSTCWLIGTWQVSSGNTQ